MISDCLLERDVMHRTSPISNHNAFTLIELLVVIGIVGALLALIVPAVLSARENARTAECANNLRMICLALHTYLDGTGVFPPAIIHSLDSKSTPRGKATAVTGWLLLYPYLDKAGLYPSYDFQHGLLPGTSGYSDDSKERKSNSQEFIQMRPRVFYCPTDTVPSLANNSIPPGICRNARKANYLFAAGANFNPLIGGPGVPGNPSVPYNESAPFYGELLTHKSTSLGMFGHSGAATLKQIIDGQSNTIAAGESLQDHAGGDRTAVVWGQGKLYGQMAVVDGFGVETARFQNPPASRTTINHREAGGVSPAVLSSNHWRGINVVFADGRVKFLNQDIAVDIYNTLFMIRDGAEVPISY